MLRHAIIGYLLAVVACGSFASADETGVQKARFVYGGPAPEAKPINVAAGVACAGLVDESLLVHAENRGIRNVVMYVHTGRNGAKLPPQEQPQKTRELVIRNCRFDPHIMIAQAGDNLKVINWDGVGHNPNLNFFANQPMNFALAVGEHGLVAMPKAEPAPIPLEDNVHPWIKGYAVVLDHPFAAATDEDGVLTIEGLPTGQKLPFRIFIEAAGRISEVNINGEATQLDRNRLDTMIQPGMNDLGEIVIPASAFNRRSR